MNATGVVDILLVEDSPTDVEMTVRAFRRQNLANRLTVARDGAEALEILFGSPDGDGRNPEVSLPRLILLDLNMPRVSGHDVLRRVKSEESTRRIPVVVLTSSREEQDILESYNLGVNSYIVKPVDFDKFSEAVAGLGFYWLLLNQPPNA
jgi:CheY-like chemotaxis protein